MENILEQINDYFMNLAGALGKALTSLVELFVHLVPLFFLGLVVYIISNFFR